MTDPSSFIANARPLGMDQPPAVPLARSENSSVYSDDGGFRTHVFVSFLLLLNSNIALKPGLQPAATSSEPENGSDSSRRAAENLNDHHDAPEDVRDVHQDAEAPPHAARAGTGREGSSATTTTQQDRRPNAISVTLTSVSSPAVEPDMSPINEVRIVVGELQNSITVRYARSFP